MPRTTRRGAQNVIVTGAFDKFGSREVRFLEEVAKLGPVHVALWSDAVVRAEKGENPRFPFKERRYLLEAIRFVNHVLPVRRPSPANIPPECDGLTPAIWAVDEKDVPALTDSLSGNRGLIVRIVRPPALRRRQTVLRTPKAEEFANKRALVTGCFDWLHSGHIRFFEETAAYGDLYVGVGSDDNLRRLKGRRHPLFPQDERRYMVEAVRHVRHAFIPSGSGWVDAEPEIAVLQPDIYIVNEDGDRPEKRAFCRKKNIEYLVLKRRPKKGLPSRHGTILRGF